MSDSTTEPIRTRPIRPTRAGYIRVKVTVNDKKVMYCRVNLTSRMDLVKLYIAKKALVEPKTHRLFFEGVRIADEATAHGLGIEEGEEMELRESSGDVSREGSKERSREPSPETTQADSSQQPK